MSLRLLREKGIPLPPVETEEGLTAKDILDAMRGFYLRLEKELDSEIADYAESYFLELMANYPKSMCSQHMTDSLKLLIASIYFESKSEPNDKELTWEGYSYEDLSVIFDKSKASIHEAIRQKETQVKQLLEESQKRTEAKAIALRELIEEEKAKLRREKENNQKNEQMSERTANTPEREDNIP